jgi:hypothetical protein
MVVCSGSRLLFWLSARSDMNEAMTAAKITFGHCVMINMPRVIIRQKSASGAKGKGNSVNKKCITCTLHIEDLLIIDRGTVHVLSK